MATNKPETPTRYQEIKYRSDQPVRMVGKFTAEHVKRTWKEDFLDKNTKQVITVDRYETIITRGQEISHDMIPKILFHMQAGELKDILVSNQRRMRDQVKRTHPTPFIVNLHMGDRGCKVIVQATSIKQAINIAADWAEQTGEGHFEVKPDILGDFTNMPYPDNYFKMVVFDPPHLKKTSDKETASGWQMIKYGYLGQGWQETIRKGFAECFRVLAKYGFLIFKWNETDIPLSKILELTDQKPIFGHKSGKRSNTHWICFMKYE